MSRPGGRGGTRSRADGRGGGSRGIGSARRAHRPAQIGGGAGQGRLGIVGVVLLLRIILRRGRLRRRDLERIGGLGAIDPPALGRRVEARLARRLGLDLADRLLEGEPLARDIRLRQRRLHAAQLRHQCGTRTLVQGATGLAGTLVETGNRLVDQGVVVGHQVPAVRRGCGIIPSLFFIRRKRRFPHPCELSEFFTSRTDYASELCPAAPGSSIAKRPGSRSTLRSGART